MKKSNILVAVFAVLAAASAVKADEIDFDGKKASPVSFSELLEGVGSSQENGANLAVPKPERAEAAIPRGELKIDIIMKTGSAIKKETLVCEPGKGGLAMNGCKKLSDLTGLSKDDVSAMSLRKYFPAEKQDFASLLDQTKHSYTNQSGPMTFSCVDKCDSWTPVSSTSGCEIGTSGAGCHTTVTSECTGWTHECDCIVGC